MFQKYLFILMVFALLLTACAVQSPAVETEPPTPKPEDPLWTPEPAPTGEEPPLNPYAPGKGDESMSRGPVYIDSLKIMIDESSPSQYLLMVTGSLPTPCNSLRAVVVEPDEQNRIDVQIFSLGEPDVICADVLEPFDAAIPLGSFTSGSYTVTVNGEEAGVIAP